VFLAGTGREGGEREREGVRESENEAGREWQGEKRVREFKEW
jgi:hypothetical protein